MYPKPMDDQRGIPSKVRLEERHTDILSYSPTRASWTLSLEACCAALECAPSWQSPALGSRHTELITAQPPHAHSLQHSTRPEP